MFSKEDVINYERKNKNGIKYGTEGSVYRYGKYAVKLFKSINGEKFMNQKEEKIKKLLEMDIDGFVKPELLVYDSKKKFSGYAMKYVENKGDVGDIYYNQAGKHTLKEKIEYLKKVEELIKKAHKNNIILNDCAIWNFLVTDDDNVVGIDIDNFQFDNYKSGENIDWYLPYYQGLCNTEGRDENSDKFSFALFVLSTILEKPLANESMAKFNPYYNYLLKRVTDLNISEDAQNELYDLVSDNPKKEWIGETLEKIDNKDEIYLTYINKNVKKYF